MPRLKGLYILARESFEMIYGPAEQREIAELVDLIGRPMAREEMYHHPELLAQMDVLFSGWAPPLVDEKFLEACPRLKAIFYGAGGAGWVATPQAHGRGVVVTCAQTANSIPVAEYTLAMIIFSLKHGWRLHREMTQQRRTVPRDEAPGCYRRTVGLISLGATARTLLKLLKPLDLEVLVYDPFVAAEQAQELGAELVSLEELFERSDVVSLHAPSLEETRGMIRGQHLERMRPGATFINTARGEIVAEEEMIEVLRRRSDLWAVLDVMISEPADPQSPLFDLPNVVLTPHIAGSAGQECQRMGRYMVEELRRYLAGEPLRWRITPELAAYSIHRSPFARPKTHLAGHKVVEDAAVACTISK